MNKAELAQLRTEIRAIEANKDNGWCANHRRSIDFLLHVVAKLLDEVQPR